MNSVNEFFVFILAAMVTATRSSAPPIQAKTAKEPVINKFKIDKLPAALQEEIAKLQTEEQASQSKWGKAKLIACCALTALGAISALAIVFARVFSPFSYAVCIGAFGVGGLLVKKMFTSRKERAEQTKELQDCNKDLTSGARSPFKAHLGRIKMSEYSIPELLDLYRPFKALNQSIEERNEAIKNSVAK